MKTGIIVYVIGSQTRDQAFDEQAAESPPRQVVSLVPSITEILFRIGAGGAVAGVTVHDTFPAEAASAPVVAGFFNPSLKRIRAIHPDLIFIADLHRAVADAYAESPTPRLVQLPLNSLAELYGAVRFLGRMFDRETDAEALVQSIGSRLAHTRRKTAGVPAAMALSDQYQRGLVSDISGFQAWCGRVSEEIAGRRVDTKPVFTFSEPLPPVMKMAVEALLTGLTGRSATEE